MNPATRWYSKKLMLYKAHKAQIEVLKCNKRGIVVCAGRRFGKTKLGLFKLLLMIANHKPSSNQQYFLVAMPTLYQARQVWWDMLVKELAKHPAYERVLRNEWRIVMRGNTPDIILRGINDRDGDGVRGSEFAGVIVDEIADCSPTAWSEAIYPALKGDYLIIGTPKGKANHFHTLHQQAMSQPDMAYFHFVTADNPFYAKHLIDRARELLSPRSFRQEFEASWEAYEGMCFTSYDPDIHFIAPTDKPVVTYYLGIDWGDRNPALSVLALHNDYSWSVVDCWHSGGQVTPTNEFYKVIATYCQRWQVTRVFAPDDRPASILEARRYGFANSCQAMTDTVAVKRSKPGLAESVEIVNNLFHQNKLMVHNYLNVLNDQLLSYRYGPDGKPIKVNDHIINSIQYTVAPYEYAKHYVKSITA